MLVKPTPRNVNLGNGRFAMFNKERDISLVRSRRRLRRFQIFNGLGPASFSGRRCSVRNHDFVSDEFLALIAAGFVLLCSSLLVIALKLV